MSHFCWSKQKSKSNCQVLSLDLLPEHEVTDLVYQVEQATVLGLLRAGLHAALSLTEPGRWTGHVESARRFTLDHFIALVESRAVNDILVVCTNLEKICYIRVS